jgi:Na+-driven multidrug efflux pump
VGVEAISGMGFLAPAYILGLALSLGLGAGGGINISQQIGADNNEKANRFAEHSPVLALIVSLCLILFFVFFARPFYVFMGAQEVLETVLTCTYLFVPFLAIFLLNALFRTRRYRGRP